MTDVKCSQHAEWAGQHPLILVVSLVRAAERRAAIETQFASLDLEFEFFDAVDGKDGHALFDHYDPERVRLIGGKPLTYGQLGCFASHFLIWQRCVESGQAVIVLEDDAQIFPAQFTEFLQSIPLLPDSVECVRLFENKARNTLYYPVTELGSLQLGKYLRGHISATGYYLTPPAAGKFIAYCQSWAEPVDRLMDHFWVNGVECHGIDPPCLTHDPVQGSFMPWGEEQKAKRTLRSYIRWRSYMLRQKFGRIVHNFWYLIKARPGKARRQDFSR
ncbi:glycosyltransferase family 25 protein [uncultured Marinobacter sp.]|uniref:glycosyltransferase family 25 protein n=1 Tax=uncultured Marinobacter sp. TaxID=187379 RepID=UPI003450BD8F